MQNFCILIHPSIWVKRHTYCCFFPKYIDEADYFVALFQFMIWIGYPEENLLILSTYVYNGSKEQISDIIISQRYDPSSPFANVLSVAKYQLY